MEERGLICQLLRHMMMVVVMMMVVSSDDDMVAEDDISNCKILSRGSYVVCFFPPYCP